MRLAVVAFPRLDAEDAPAIEAFRAEHDPQARLVRAHFTIVFPLEAEAKLVIAEARRAAQDVGPFDVVLARAIAHRDERPPASRVFLLPSSRAELDLLHDRAYERALAPHLRRDLPYAPHVTIAQTVEHAGCVELAERWNARGSRSRARVEALEVLAVFRDRVERVALVQLA